MNMKPWPASHLNLAAIAGAAILIFGTGWWFFLHPRQQSLAGTRNAIRDLQTKLVPAGFPLDPERLDSLLRDQKRKGDLINRQADDIQRRATSMFDSKIESAYGSHERFRTSVYLVDYKEEYSRTEQALRSRGVVLAEDVLNIGENTESPYIYQLMLQIWTVKELADLAASRGLVFARDPRFRAPSANEGWRSLSASKISVLPMRAYYIEAGDHEPFLLEFPVRIVIRTRVEQLCQFLDSLQAGGRFLTVNQMEIIKTVPSQGRSALSDQVEATLECSSFYRLRNGGREGSTRPPKTELRPLPRGA